MHSFKTIHGFSLFVIFDKCCQLTPVYAPAKPADNSSTTNNLEQD
tara:strand:+ start:2731 stop:2865 length:135 start_codon:yes stop_codon:yes gene_type:complete